MSKNPVLLVIAAAFALVACGRDDVAHYRVPKVAPPPSAGTVAAGAPAPSPAMPASASGDVPAPPRPDAVVRWTLPKGWTESLGGGMRYATLRPAAPNAEVSVIVLPGPAGGELANVNRWRNQIGLAPVDDAALGAARVAVRSKIGPVSLYDFTSEGAKKSRVVGGLATVAGSTWFLKLAGDPAAVAAAKPDFIRLVESLRLEAN